MANLRHQPVKHDHRAFLARASKHTGFTEAYKALGPEYQLVNQLLKARSRAGLTQNAVAERMGTVIIPLGRS